MSFRDKITEIFCCAGDFYKEFSQEITQAKQLQLAGDKKRRNRAGQLSDSEVITIMIGFHQGSPFLFSAFCTTFRNYLRITRCGC